MITRRLHPIATTLGCLLIAGLSCCGGQRLEEIRRAAIIGPSKGAADPEHSVGVRQGLRVALLRPSRPALTVPPGCPAVEFPLMDVISPLIPPGIT